MTRWRIDAEKRGTTRAMDAIVGPPAAILLALVAWKKIIGPALIVAGFVITGEIPSWVK